MSSASDAKASCVGGYVTGSQTVLVELGVGVVRMGNLQLYAAVKWDKGPRYRRRWSSDERCGNVDAGSGGVK